MFNINYNKRNNELLFKSLEDNLSLTKIQNYLPIYNIFFELNDNNYNNINLNHYSFLEYIDSKISHNICECTVKSQNNISNKKLVFFKFSPLMDPSKYISGKYEDENSLFVLPNFNVKSVYEKMDDANNSAYVDAFFTYLTSSLLHEHGFLPGLDYYGSFIGLQDNFVYNIVDEIESLNNITFFNRNMDLLFTINNEFYSELFNNNTKKYKKKLKISDEYDGDMEITELKLDDLIETENKELLINKLSCKSPDKLSNKSDCSSSSCSSRTSDTDSNEEDESDDESCNKSDGDTDSTLSLDTVNIEINQFPVNVICLEHCTNTLDSLILKKEINNKEWASILFQIVMILLTYQKCFNFTHNDLHTNNVMYIETEKQHLYYKYNDVYYKIPTFGKIYKIIDFGRAIYKYKGKLICSDSFHKDGDAATQYNFEPYMNENKPRLKPNFSFDLCRLACSIYDFIIDEEDENEANFDEIQSLINEWCMDDKNKNILYKNNGDERYLGFKLYKMIARTVHNHTPQAQLDREIFQQFKTSKKKINKKIRIINIDDLPVYS